MITELLPNNGLILCAVSGGADSVCLLFRLRELGLPVTAAHFNHGLRGESADRDEAFVRRLCAGADIPFVSGRGNAAAHAAQMRLGIEEAARELRYAYLEKAADELGASVIATAHTADDNAETVLMHLTRGAGLNGLCGIPPVRGRVVRPLLDETHDDAVRYLEERGIPHVEDETNAEDDCFRNRVRHHILPALRAENPAFSQAVLRTAELLRADEGYLSGLADAFLREHADGNALPAGALARLPRPVALRAVRNMAGGVSARQAEQILEIDARGGYADVTGMRVGRSGDRLVFGVRCAAPLPDRLLPPDGILPLPETGLAVSCVKLSVCPEDVYKSLNTFFFKFANICGNMTVTARKPGDAYRPARRGCTKELRRLLAEAGVPRWERDSVPVLRDEQGILGVPGVGPAERTCARPGDRDVLRIEFTSQEETKAKCIRI